MGHSRRRFLRPSALAVAGVGTARLSRAVQPSDKINVGVVGCKGMGFADLQSLLKIDEVDCRALCDIDANVLRERAAEVESSTSLRRKRESQRLADTNLPRPLGSSERVENGSHGVTSNC